MTSVRAQIGITIGLFACCAIFCALGFWQITRAEEKRFIETQLKASLASAARPLNLESKPYSRVSVLGRYHPSQVIYVDNRVHHGRPGVQVLHAFDAVSGQRILVDRGWMSFPDRRIQLPPPVSPTEEIEIIGVLLPDFGVGFSLENNPSDQQETSYPWLIQQLDLKFITSLIGTEQKFLLRLRGGEPGALTTEPFKLPMGSERHLAYAVQWFGLALASIIIWLYLARRHLASRTKSDE